MAKDVKAKEIKIFKLEDGREKVTLKGKIRFPFFDNEKGQFRFGLKGTRFSVPFQNIKNLKMDNGVMSFEDGALRYELKGMGSNADKWIEERVFNKLKEVIG